MLVEHTFVTTLSAADALLVAGSLLKHLGFQVEPPGEAHLEACRGVKNPARAKRISDAPQRIRLDYDRGRITVAASAKVYRKPNPLHAEMLTTLAKVLERLLAEGLCEADAREDWDRVEEDIALHAVKQRHREHIWIVVLVMLITIPIFLAILASGC